MRKEELAIRLELFESIFNGGNVPSCNPLANGVPRCALGQIITGHWKPKCVQIAGRNLGDLTRNEWWKVPGFTDKRIPKYKIFVIMDAPGRAEDSTNLPIAGDSYKLLVDICNNAGLPLDEIFVTNVVRCRPPKNRQPSTKEIRSCLVHLYHDIDKFKPEIIILAGRTALSVFNIREGGINKVRGKLYEKPLPYWTDGPIFKIIPTLNPGALLRRDNQKVQNRVTDDFRIAKALLEQKEPKVELYKPEYKACLTVADVTEAVEAILAHGVFAFDTESPDLRLKSSPMMITQLSCGKGKTWIIPFYRHDPFSQDEFKLRSQFTNQEREDIVVQLKRIFENEGIIKFGHHIKYDNNVIKRWLGVEIKGDGHDTQVLHHLLDCYPPHDLKYLADIEFATGNYAAEVEAIVGKGKDLNKTWDNVPDEVLWPYSATDAEVSYRLGELYLDQVRAKANLWKLYQEESYPAIKAFEDAEWEGVKVDLVNLNKTEVYYKEQLEKSEAAAVALTGVPDFNPHSPEKVKNALIARGLAKEIEAPLTASKYSANKEVLLKLDDELADLVLKCRKYRKRLSTYVERVLTDLQKDGKVRYSFNLSGTVSGRQSCRVYHQMPKLSDEKDAAVVLRSIFCEDDDYDIVFSDFSQIELRIFAYLTGDIQLITALENNEDVHAGTAGDAIGIPIQEVSDFNRSNVGKPLNFGGIFGSKGSKIADCKFENPQTGRIEVVGEERAKRFIENFTAAHPKIREFMQEVPDEALAMNCVVRSCFGRQRRIPDLTSKHLGIREAAEREAVNFKVQSPATSICTRTIVEIKKVLDYYNIGADKVRFLITVHDSLLYGVRKDHTEWFKKTLKQIAERPIKEIKNKTFPINIGYGRTWADAEIASKDS